MAAGDGETVFSFGKPPYGDDKMYQRCIGVDYSTLDELDDDVFHPDDYIFPGQSESLNPPSFFSQTQSYTCFLGRVQLFPLSHCCGPGNRSTEHKDKATQTHSPSSPSDDIMLPCGVTEEPQRLFYGNAGYRLHVPTSLDLNLHLQEGVQHGRQDISAEIHIARKLQRIGDQFHRQHIQRVQQNRNQIWWQIFLFFRNLAMNA